MANKESIQKYAFEGIYIELTRNCNLRCAHCMLGEPQDVTITPEIIDALLSQTSSIARLTIGGGEPLLELNMFEYLLNALERYNVPVLGLGLVHNGTIFNERVMQIINDYLKRNPKSLSKIEVSADIFHDRERSERCTEFYKSLAGERCEVALHRGFKALRHSGRVWGKRSVCGVPTLSISDAAIRSHRLNVTADNVIRCSMHLAANGNLIYGGDISFDTADKLALGNVLESSLQDIIAKNFRECPYLCDECYKETMIVGYEDFAHKSKTIDNDINLYRWRIGRKHLEFVWELRAWAFDVLPQVDPRAIIMGTIITDADFTEYVKQYCIRHYRALKNIKSDEEASNHFSLIACTEHQKAIKKKFPTATQDEIYALSALKVLYGAMNNMTLDDFKRALFNSNPAEGYFATIEKRLKDHGEDFEALDPCAKIPDTLDPDKEEGDADADPNEESQPNAAS